ncbi:MAG: hypothetical protein JW709_01450, partial [Sedimentisphaerales bacterium]|nr:hypothetical protein [Sedimentisphaerales bacterium]
MIKPVKIFVMGVVLLYAGSFMFAADESVSEETESEVDEILLKQIGDIDDGSRAKTVHHFPLYDDQDFEIFPDSIEPFSTRQTCGKCHDYDTISQGWHFNAGLMDKPAGRRAQPWLYWDAAIGVQFPLSYRKWEGVFSPSEAGLTQWDFVRIFGRQLPGGMAGEKMVSNKIDPGDKWELSGMLEVNCLACHNVSYRQDQS